MMVIRNILEMECSTLAFTVLIVLIPHTRFVVDGVSCFNCVSTENPGCGQNLDLTLLVKSASASVQPKNKREATFPPAGIEHHSQYNLEKRDVSDFEGSTLHLNNNFVNESVEDEIIQSNWSFKSNGANNMSRDFHDNSRHNLTVTQMQAGTAVPGDFQLGVESKRESANDRTTTSQADVNGIGRGKMFDEIEKGRNDFPASHLMVKCPGNTCLTQRITTTTGNVFVRTCDISNRVPIGQCHLVTNVLGASVSVVCVCEGHFCNENKASCTEVLGAGIGMSLVINVVVWMVGMLCGGWI